MDPLFKLASKHIQAMDLEPWLEQKSEVLRPIARKWFTSIMKCGNDIQEVFHDGCPVACIEDTPFAYVNTFKEHVNLGFFYGADLPDERDLLEGSGKRMRHVKLRPEETIDERALIQLIHFAYQDIKDKLLLV
ncbi:MAG: DUF1801 domain-containing protein [Cyclobacteriaceae bacterium]